jgi:hypothetical protein
MYEKGPVRGENMKNDWSYPTKALESKLAP